MSKSTRYEKQHRTYYNTYAVQWSACLNCRSVICDWGGTSSAAAHAHTHTRIHWQNNTVRKWAENTGQIETTGHCTLSITSQVEHLTCQIKLHELANSFNGYNSRMFTVKLFLVWHHTNFGRQSQTSANYSTTPSDAFWRHRHCKSSFNSKSFTTDICYTLLITYLSDIVFM